MKFNNGDYYKGQWDSGKRDGYGDYTWPTGSHYRGMFANDKRNGQGELYDVEATPQKTGNMAGRFMDSMMHGYVEKTWADGHAYRGLWLFGKRSGYGEMQFPDGRFYRGYWLADAHDGPGETHHPNGAVERGFWKKGALVVPVM